MIRNYFFKAIRFLFRYNFFWKLSQPIIKFADNLKHQKFWTDRRAIDKHIKQQILKTPIVKMEFLKAWYIQIF